MISEEKKAEANEEGQRLALTWLKLLDEVLTEQKENKDLWFPTQTPQEGSLQQALKRLHRVIEEGE